jgi:hypothetical protein
LSGSSSVDTKGQIELPGRPGALPVRLELARGGGASLAQRFGIGLHCCLFLTASRELAEVNKRAKDQQGISETVRHRADLDDLDVIDERKKKKKRTKNGRLQHLRRARVISY